MGVNYLGSGVTNIEKPVQYYNIMDKRNNVIKTDAIPVTQKFNSVLESVRAKGVSNVKPKSTKITVATVPIQKVKSTVNAVGTDFALKKLSKEMENQLYGMFWTMIDSARNAEHEGGFAEKLFRGPYLAEIVKTSSDVELGEIGQAIYHSLAESKS